METNQDRNPHNEEMAELGRKLGVDLEDMEFVAKRRIRLFLDKITPFIAYRWTAVLVMLLFFGLRMYQQ